MTTSELVDFYKNYFLPIYADVVAMLADKPQQIIFEIENTFSHLMVALDTNNNQKIIDQNIQKAYGHLLRSTLDCYKILWTEMSSHFDKVINNENLRHYIFNNNDEKILSAWHEFRKKAQTARKHEMESVGKNQLNTITLYKAAIDEGRFLMDSFDFSKYESSKKFQLGTLLKTHSIGFIFGLLASGIVAIISAYT